MSKKFLLGASALVLASCSGSDSGGGSPTGPTGGSGGGAPITAAGSGVITGFGSIIVNGTRYQLDGSTAVTVNGQTGAESDLRLGMVVRFAASGADGDFVAADIEYERNLVCPADDVDPNPSNPAVGDFTVCGQLVLIDDNTVLDDSIGDNNTDSVIDLNDLDPVNLGGANAVVEVSGYPTATGYLATRVERLDATGGATFGDPTVPGDEFEVEGFIDSVATDLTSFVVNGATFAVDGATTFEDGVTLDQSLVGAFVEVAADDGGSGGYVATAVEVIEQSDVWDETLENLTDFEIKGVLAAVDATANTISINGLTIDVTAAGEFANFVGLLVEIEGEFDAAGVLTIQNIEAERGGDVRVEDQIASINTQAGTFTTRLGVVVTPTGDSRILDQGDEEGDQFSVAEFFTALQVGDTVRARAEEDANGGRTWTRVTVLAEAEGACSFQGPLDAGTISDPSFSLAGLVIDTTGLGDGGFVNASGDETRAAFFSSVAAGDVVKATSDTDGLGCTPNGLATGVDGFVSVETDDFVVGDEVIDEITDPLVAVDTVSGVVSGVDAENNTLNINGVLVQIEGSTLITPYTISSATQGEMTVEGSVPFGELGLPFATLFQQGLFVFADVTADNIGVEVGLLP